MRSCVCGNRFFGGWNLLIFLFSRIAKSVVGTCSLALLLHLIFDFSLAFFLLTIARPYILQRFRWDGIRRTDDNSNFCCCVQIFLSKNAHMDMAKHTLFSDCHCDYITARAASHSAFLLIWYQLWHWTAAEIKQRPFVKCHIVSDTRVDRV